MVIMPMGGVVIGVAGVICNSQCTGFGQYTTEVVLRLSGGRVSDTTA